MEAAVPVAACYVHNRVGPCLGLGAVQDALNPTPTFPRSPYQGQPAGLPGSCRQTYCSYTGGDSSGNHQGPPFPAKSCCSLSPGCL